MTADFHLIQLDAVESTMIEAANLVAGGEFSDWTTIVARHQTQGRGRGDRSWVSNPGDALLGTVIARLPIAPERSGLIAIAAGLGIARALDDLGVYVRLKWPNDLVVGERKLGGILIQTQIGAPLIAMVGVGVNLRAVPTGMANDAVAMAELLSNPPTPERAARLIVPRLMTVLTALADGEVDTILAAWTARALWLGERISVVGDREVTGVLEGIDKFGRLLVRTDEGIEALTQGEVRRGPRKVA